MEPLPGMPVVLMAPLTPMLPEDMYRCEESKTLNASALVERVMFACADAVAAAGIVRSAAVRAAALRTNLRGSCHDRETRCGIRVRRRVRLSKNMPSVKFRAVWKFAPYVAQLVLTLGANAVSTVAKV